MRLIRPNSQLTPGRTRKTWRSWDRSSAERIPFSPSIRPYSPAIRRRPQPAPAGAVDVPWVGGHQKHLCRVRFTDTGPHSHKPPGRASIAGHSRRRAAPRNAVQSRLPEELTCHLCWPIAQCHQPVAGLLKGTNPRTTVRVHAKLSEALHHLARCFIHVLNQGNVLEQGTQVLLSDPDERFTEGVVRIRGLSSRLPKHPSPSLTVRRHTGQECRQGTNDARKRGKRCRVSGP
jgi:hypothetical protein